MTTLPSIIQSSKNIDNIITQLNQKNIHFPVNILNMHGGLFSFFVYSYFLQQKKPLVIIAPDEKEARDLVSDLQGICDEQHTATTIYHFPWWGMVPYRPVAKGARVFGERASILAKLQYAVAQNEPSIFVFTERSALNPVPPPEYIQSLIFSLSVGQNFDSIKLSETLVQYGYVRVPRVTVAGEFTLRGEVLDIFMPGEENAHRIQFDFDTIEKIRIFDVETQTSYENLTELLIYPMKEIVWTDSLVQDLEQNLQNNNCDHLLTQLLVQHESEGEELFYPLVHYNNKTKKYSSIFNYLHDDTPLFLVDYDRQVNAQGNFIREYQGLYEKALQLHFVPPPESQILDFLSLIQAHKTRIMVRSLKTEQDEEETYFELNAESAKNYFGNIPLFKESLQYYVDENWHVFIYCGAENQALRLQELLKEFPVHFIPQSLSSGFILEETKLIVIQENEIFGRKKHTPKSLKHVKSAVIDTFVELNPGDYVVHVNYGIGLFKGIERVKALGNERDYIKLEYLEEEIVFIPIEQVNLVQRYIGNEGEAPRLDRLGSKSWENRKNKVKKSVEDIAQKLIDLYSRRKAIRGFSFPKDSEFMTAFEAAFPYHETEDQIIANEEIKADMEKQDPMDRLLCGDVGYGKTELALRSAFKAILGGKQVAFLAPTTLLAEQHYETAIERFSNFPVTIAQMSRFISKAEQKKTLEKVKQGNVDILIGTHRIIQKDVIFKDLGLMIIDEEQRFGVKDKEKLKEFRTNIDCLAMSATPIPRTLHMSLLKIRDMSILKTPPQNRQAIETVIDAYSDERVVQAIRNEVERGGQVFYLHNRVGHLEDIQAHLQKILPEMMIDIAHGQMTSTELEDIFRRFKLGGFHVLIATIIIENGIDISNVNTIIIDRADMYGVSQLYQLRGRVGRSDRKAYAYLLYPDNRVLNELAMKRLQIISDFTELGSGFKIAMKDMEIRGAGNLLGKDQSGDVYSVGFDLYLRLLEEAIEKLSNVDYAEEQEVLLELDYTGFIPDSYIPNIQTKMEIYKKIASITLKEELTAIRVELLDRFGPVPQEVLSLLAIAQIKIICKKLYISHLQEKQGNITVTFDKVSYISVEKVLNLIKTSEGTVKLDPKQPNILRIKCTSKDLHEKSQFIVKKLESLSS